MLPKTKLIETMEEQAEALRSDLSAIELAIVVLRRLSGTAIAQLEAPKRRAAVEDMQQHVVTKRQTIKDPERKSVLNLPEGVSADSTLEPDYVINDVPLFFTDKERLLFDTLNEAPEGECVSMEQCMKGSGINHQPTLYATMGKLKEKLAAADSTIANERGIGYRLAVKAA